MIYLSQVKKAGNYLIGKGLLFRGLAFRSFRGGFGFFFWPFLFFLIPSVAVSASAVALICPTIISYIPA